MNEAKSVKSSEEGTSLVAQWLGLGAFTAVAPGLIPGWGTKPLQDMVKNN